MCVAGVWNPQTTSFEIPWFLGISPPRPPNRKPLPISPKSRPKTGSKGYIFCSNQSTPPPNQKSLLPGKQPLLLILTFNSKNNKKNKLVPQKIVFFYVFLCDFQRCFLVRSRLSRGRYGRYHDLIQPRELWRPLQLGNTRAIPQPMRWMYFPIIIATTETTWCCRLFLNSTNYLTTYYGILFSWVLKTHNSLGVGL